jgi:hypothetical protein
VSLVRGEDDVIAASGSTFDHGNVDDVFVIGSASQLTHAASPIGVHLLDVTTRQHAGQAALARSTPPSLGDYGSGDGRYHFLGDETDV